MTYIVAGLGNPGSDYALTRHNAGRLVVEALARGLKAGEWKADKRLSALRAGGQLGRAMVNLILPDAFMNNSGKSIKPLVSSVKAAERLVVVHDDMDLPLGSLKVSFNRGAGGHKGIESIIRAIKTKAFIRVRLGVCPTTLGGKLKKPVGEDQVVKFIIGAFKPAELAEFKKVTKRAVAALEAIVAEGREAAMGEFNQA